MAQMNQATATVALLPRERNMDTVIDCGLGRIPAKRGWSVFIINLLLGGVLSVVYIVWLVVDAQRAESDSQGKNVTCQVQAPPEAKQTILEEVSLFFISMIAAIVIIYVTRIVNFIVEGLKYFETRYDRSWLKLASSTLTIKNLGDLTGLAFLLTSGIMIVVFFISGIEDDTKKTIGVVLGAVGLTQMFTVIMRLGDQTTAQLSEATESEHFNIATGMAWNYYTGYLELVLTTSDDHENLVTTLRKVGLDGVMSSSKLYLLVPSDCVCRRVLTLGDDNVKIVGKVRSRMCNRAGVEGRQYWNTVYQIKHTMDNVTRYYYCCCEYITPIDTLNQMKIKGCIDRDKMAEQVKMLVGVLRDLITGQDFQSHNNDPARILTFDQEKVNKDYGGISGWMVHVLTQVEGDNLRSFDSEQTFEISEDHKDMFRR